MRRSARAAPGAQQSRAGRTKAARSFCYPSSSEPQAARWVGDEKVGERERRAWRRLLRTLVCAHRFRYSERLLFSKRSYPGAGRGVVVRRGRGSLGGRVGRRTGTKRSLGLKDLSRVGWHFPPCIKEKEWVVSVGARGSPRQGCARAELFVSGFPGLGATGRGSSSLNLCQKT